DAPSPVVGAWTFCDEDERRAREMAVRWIGGDWRPGVDPHQREGDHPKHTKGYRGDGRPQDILGSGGGGDAGPPCFPRVHGGGTPDQCVEKILRIRDVTGMDWFNAIFSYAGMPWDDAERSMRLFARAVMPRLQALGAGARAAHAG